MMSLPKFALASLSLLFGACTLLLDPSEHRGATRDADVAEDGAVNLDGAVELDAMSEEDAGPDASVECDVDGDGFEGPQCGGDDCNDENPNIHPFAAPICNNGAFEGCPGEAPIEPTDIFGDVARHGLLRPTTLATGRLLPEVGIGALGYAGAGYGRAIAIMAEYADEDGYRPLRIDVPLANIGAHTAEDLGNTPAQRDLRVGSIATSVTETETVSAVGVGFAKAGVGVWWFIVELASETTHFWSDANTAQHEGTALAIHGNSRQFGSRSGSGASLQYDWVQGGWGGAGGIQAGAVLSGVPEGNLRTRTARSGVSVFQEGAGGLWFFPTAGASGQGMTDLSDEFASYQGKLAFAQVSGTRHALGLFDPSPAPGRFRFEQLECRSSGLAPFCDVGMPIGGWPSISAGEAGGEVPDAFVLADGRVGFVLIRRALDGDELVIRFVSATGLQMLAAPPIVLLDTRGTGERILDAAVDLASGSLAESLVVLVSLGAELGGEASRVVLTGMRGCATD